MQNVHDIKLYTASFSNLNGNSEFNLNYIDMISCICFKISVSFVSSIPRLRASCCVCWRSMYRPPTTVRNTPPREPSTAAVSPSYTSNTSPSSRPPVINTISATIVWVFSTFCYKHFAVTIVWLFEYVLSMLLYSKNVTMWVELLW